MLPRKPFGELLKSQKNRRLKRNINELLLPDISSPIQPSSVSNVITNCKQDTVDDISSPIQTSTDSNIITSFKPDIVHDTNINNSIVLTNDVAFDDNIIFDNYDNNLDQLNSIESCSAVKDKNIEILQNEIAEVDKKVDLKCQIAQWQCQYNISQAATGSLLKTLTNVTSIEELKNLPTDSRTLLSTPRTTVIRSVSPGEYFHYGLKQGLIDQLKSIGIDKFTSNLSINVHIDGLLISKSSKRQLYPILAEIFPKVASPIVIGVYHGLNKPDDCNDFLKDIINEYKILYSEGFEYNHRRFFVKIRAVICDSPARSYVTYTKGHTGYYGCSKCVQEGDYKDHRMRCLQIDAPVRTDDNFIDRLNEDHHLGKSKFEETEIGMVTQFPVEYMHLICLGVEKKILKAWISGFRLDNNKLIKLSHKQTTKISDLLLSLKSWIPSEFVRKTRGLDEVDRWKATEFRLFLLYVGPIALKSVIPAKYLFNFNSLQCAIRILCDETDCIRNNKCAKDLLNYFVTKCVQLYGENFVIYNVHNLIHLPEDVLKFGHLDTFSAFSFESYLGFLKKLLKKHDKPLQQLHKRIKERVKYNYKQNIKQSLNKPEISSFNKKKFQKSGISSYDKINYGNFTLSTCQKYDSFCYLINNDVVRINNIYVQNNSTMLKGQTLINPKSVENYPIDSKLINIVTGNEWSVEKNYDVSDVSQKAVCIPCDDLFYFFPLIHSSN